MVQKVQESPADEPQGEEAPIFDETSPEQVQRETAVAEGRNPDAEPVTPEPTAEAPAEPTPPAATPQAPPAEAPATPQPRVYSQGELDAIQDQWRQRYRGQQRVAEETRQRLTALDLEAQVEAHLRSEEARLAATMGEAEARTFARAPEQVQRVRSNVAAQQQLQEIRMAAAQQTQQSELALQTLFARELAREHNIPADDLPLLMANQTPEGMEKLAKRLGRANEDKAKEKAAIKAAVPPETRQTALESGMSGHSAPESDDTRINRLNETPSFEWTDDDVKYMRRLAS